MGGPRKTPETLVAVGKAIRAYDVKINQSPSRELWHPSDEDQLSAIEILLACALSRELRAALRERAEELARRAPL